MKTVQWSRQDRLNEIRDRIWLYIPRTSTFEGSVHPEAAALLQLPEADLDALVRLHLALSGEVGRLLDGMPVLIRRLSTTTVQEEEWSVERVRGPIAWGPTIGARLSSGLPHVYVTRPARRAHQTPENEMLVFMLDLIHDLATSNTWFGNQTGAGRELLRRSGLAQESRQRRVFQEIERRPPSDRTAHRVRTGRFRERYANVVAAHDLYTRMVVQLEQKAISNAIAQRAITATKNDTLFEILVLFALVDGLKENDWLVQSLRLFGSPRGLSLTAKRSNERLRLWYQQAPHALSAHSLYEAVQNQHGFGDTIRPLRPDFALRHKSPNGSVRWVVGEAKLRQNVHSAARAALKDLLMYRRALRAQLAGSHCYGLGIAWGEGLNPSPESDEAVLCTPDRLTAALGVLLPKRPQ